MCCFGPLEGPEKKEPLTQVQGVSQGPAATAHCPAGGKAHGDPQNSVNGCQRGKKGVGLFLGERMPKSFDFSINDLKYPNY